MLWDSHFAQIQTSLARVVGILRKVQWMLPTKTKLLIYHALFQSHLNYCHLVWGTTTAKNMQKLLVLQKQALRAIARVPPLSSSSPLFSKYRIINVNHLYDFRLLQLFKTQMQNNVTFLSDSASLHENLICHYTRHHEHWHIKPARTNYGHQTLSYTLPLALNKYDFDDLSIRSTSYTTLRKMFLCFYNTA